MDKSALPKTSLRKYKDTNLFGSCNIDEIESMEVKEDDTWVLSFPRSGTTLTQEIVYMLKTNLDFKTAKETPLDHRFPFLDMYMPDMTNFQGLRQIEVMTSPRLIKSHLHHHVLPKQLFESNCKKIYVMRNPKDVAVSCLMLTKFLKQTDPDEEIDAFLEDWLNEKTYATPWWRHVRDFWVNRNDTSLLVLKYEDIVQDMYGSISDIADHINVNVTADEIRQIADHCSFNRMKRNASTNARWMSEERRMDERFGGHIRRGKVGGWRDFMSLEMSKKFDNMVSDKLRGTDLQFNFE